jgi:tRNA (mo5U34)-methyltransferase
MAFIEHRLEGDATNWWAPNHAAVEAMARSAGLEILERPGHELYVCRPGQRAPDTGELDAATGR